MKHIEMISTMMPMANKDVRHPPSLIESKISPNNMPKPYKNAKPKKKPIKASNIIKKI